MATKPRTPRKTAKRAASATKLKFIESMDCLPVAKLPEGPRWSYEIKLSRLGAGVWTLPLSQEKTYLEALPACPWIMPFLDDISTAHRPWPFFVPIRSQSPSGHEHVFDGLGIKLFDGLPAIPTCCRASGNGNWEDTGKGFPLRCENHRPCSMDRRGCAAGDRRPLDGSIDPERPLATVCFQAPEIAY